MRKPPTIVVGDLFRSNQGHGKYLARVERVMPDVVELKMVNRTGKSWRLPLWFFDSPVCGWTREE